MHPLHPRDRRLWERQGSLPGAWGKVEKLLPLFLGVDFLYRIVLLPEPQYKQSLNALPFLAERG